MSRFHFGAIIKNAAVNICIQVLVLLNVCFQIFLEIARSGHAGSFYVPLSDEFIACSNCYPLTQRAAMFIGFEVILTKATQQSPQPQWRAESGKIETSLWVKWSPAVLWEWSPLYPLWENLCQEWGLRSSRPLTTKLGIRGWDWSQWKRYKTLLLRFSCFCFVLVFVFLVLFCFVFLMKQSLIVVGFWVESRVPKMLIQTVFASLFIAFVVRQTFGVSYSAIFTDIHSVYILLQLPINL